MSAIYDNIKYYSKKRGYSLQKTAELSGLSKNAIYQYNNGKNPSYNTLNKIAEVLNVSFNDLTGHDKYDLKSDNDKLHLIPADESDPLFKNGADPILVNTDELNPTQSNKNKTADLKKIMDEFSVLQFDGKDIPEEDLPVIERIIKGLLDERG